MEKWKNKQERRAASGKSFLSVDWNETPDFSLFDSFSMYESKKNGKVPPRFILLDSESTHCTFYTAKYLKNIRTSKHPILVHTNGGTMICVLEGDLPGFGPVYFNPNGIANILSLAVVEARGRRITYDSWLGGRFKVHNPDSRKIIDFCQLPSGLYAHDTEAEKMPDAHTFVETVEENKKVFTARQFIKAKAARELYGMVGVPSAADFITAVRNKMIPNTKVTVDDIKTAEAIFGKDLGAIKGKTTRSRPAPVVTDQMMLPPDLMENHKTITLAADIFFVNKIPFFITVSQHISFATGDRLPNRNSGTIVSALLRVVALYSKRGFIVAICNMDNEFECIKNLLMKRRHGIQLNICAPDKHVPEIERKIRTVKERI